MLCFRASLARPLLTQTLPPPQHSWFKWHFFPFVFQGGDGGITKVFITASSQFRIRSFHAFVLISLNRLFDLKVQDDLSFTDLHSFSCRCLPQKLRLVGITRHAVTQVNRTGIGSTNSTCSLKYKSAHRSALSGECWQLARSPGTKLEVYLIFNFFVYFIFKLKWGIKGWTGKSRGRLGTAIRSQASCAACCLGWTATLFSTRTKYQFQK